MKLLLIGLICAVLSSVDNVNAEDLKEASSFERHELAERDVEVAEELEASHTSMKGPRNDVFNIVNQERQNNGGLHPYRRNCLLDIAAQKHAKWMVDNFCQSHYSWTPYNNDCNNPPGNVVGPATRMSAAGYSYNFWGENIFLNGGTAESAMSGWMASTGHRNNILHSSFCEIGIGAIKPSAPQGWTQVFGRASGLSNCDSLQPAPKCTPVAVITAKSTTYVRVKSKHRDGPEAKKWKYRYKKKSGGSWKSSDLLSKPGIKKKKITGLKRCTKYIIQTKERDADKFWSGWSAKTNFKTKGC